MCEELGVFNRGGLGICFENAFRAPLWRGDLDLSHREEPHGTQYRLE